MCLGHASVHEHQAWMLQQRFDALDEYRRRRSRRRRGGRRTRRGSSSCCTAMWPLWTTGRSMIAFGPMIATSGWLMTGVVTTPPMGPKLVIVIVEPESSSRVALLSRAAVETRATSAGGLPEVHRFGVMDDGDDQAVRGLRGDADVDGGEAVDDAGFVVEAGVDLRELGQHADRARASRTAAASASAGRRVWWRSSERAALRVPSCRLLRHRRSAGCGAWFPASSPRSCGAGR